MDEQMKSISDRLDRFETNVTAKLELLTDAMVKLARTEEKLIAIENDRANQVQRLNRFSEKLDMLDKKVDANTRSVQGINKFFWISATAVVGAVVAIFFGITPT